MMVRIRERSDDQVVEYDGCGKLEVGLVRCV